SAQAIPVDRLGRFRSWLAGDGLWRPPPKAATPIHTGSHRPAVNTVSSRCRMWVGAVGLTSWVSSVGHRPGDVRPPPEFGNNPGPVQLSAFGDAQDLPRAFPFGGVDSISSDGTS